jgi:mRNA interferase RelE/StbE
VLYRIQLKPAARRDLVGLPRDALKRIDEKIRSLAGTPRPFGVEKLSGEHSIFRVRVGEYRILYSVDDRDCTVLVTRIRHRREVYR